MTAIDTVQALNSVFDDYDFVAVRDALEGSSSDAISSEIVELNQLVRGSLAPDVVVEFHRGFQLPEGARHEGLEGYLGFFRGWLAAFDEYRLDHGGYEQIGDSVVVDVVHVGRGRGSGLPVEFPQTQRWVFRDGTVAELHIYETRAEAVADTE